MGDNEIDWDETELIHVAACALALGGGFFDSINPDVVANKAIEVAKLIIAKAKLDCQGAEESGVRTHLSTCRFYSQNSTNIYTRCSYCDQEINGWKRPNIWCGEPVPRLHNERCTLPRGHAGEHALWRPSFESASEAHAAGVPVLGAAGVRPDMGVLAVRLCHEGTGLQGDPETAEVVAKWLMHNYDIREAMVPCKKTPIRNADGSLVMACGLPNGHDGRCDFTRRVR